MKLLILLLSLSLFASSAEWKSDFRKAQQEASAGKKMLLLNFSGSDWCGPCIRLKNEIFGDNAFSNYASEHLVLVNADFPRLKKNLLSKEQTKQNEELADKYNKEGKFPFTVIMDGNGKVLKAWDGFPKETPEQFLAEIKTIVNAGN